MKKVFTFFIFFLAFQQIAWSQNFNGPKFKFTSATPCSGEEFCVDISVEDFTDITSVKYPIVWDTSVVEFIGINDLNLAELDQGDFDLSRVNEGLILLDWEFMECNLATSAITLADDLVIFKLCFRAIANYGETTTIEIVNDSELTDDPEPVNIQRLNVCGVNIGYRQEEAFISTCVTPLQLFATSTQGNTGELVSIDIKSRGFRSLSSLQFSLNWDPSILEFESVIPLENLPNLSISGFGTPAQPNVGPGNLTMSWSFIDSEDPGVNLGDDLSIFTVNFRIIGDCETSSAVDFSSIPTLVEAINTTIENDQQLLRSVPIRLTNGEVNVGACEPEGLLVFADCGGPVNLNEEICVRISAGDLANLTDMRYLMEWNPNILQFKGVRNLNTAALPGLNNSDFDTNNTGNGILEVDWESASEAFNANLTNGDLLFDVCFDVVGLGGNSPFRFDPLTAFVRQQGSFRNIGIFPSSCAVEVNQPPGVTIAIADTQGPPSDTVCMDVTASNFQELLDLQFSLSWEPNHAIFAGIQNINPLLADSSNFGTDGTFAGSLTFEWSDIVERSLPDDAVLFTLCLEVTGTPPGELSQETNCQDVAIVDFPLEGQAISASSNGNNIGVTALDGEVCVLNPEGFFLAIENETAYRGNEACIEFKVAEFDDITSAQFTVNWDPTQLQFGSEIRIDAIADLQIGLNLDTSSAAVGVIGFDWNAPGGLTLPDSAVIFEVCYDVIGAANNCVDIEINSSPNPSVTTINGAGSVFPLGGGVCIRDTLIIVDSIITAVTCPDNRDGTIELQVEGGSGEVFYNWRTLTTTQFLPQARNLPVGEVAVTIFDNSLPPLITRDTFFIPLTDNLPFADAGEDKTINCDNGLSLLSGGGSEGNYSYRWATSGGTIGGNPENRTIVATEPGLYILAVIDDETGCAARDTVEVFAPETPVANAGLDVFFNCADTVKVLDASGSTAFDTSLVYEWQAFSGGIIEPGDENVVMPRIRNEGKYALTVRFKETGCFATDTVDAFTVIEFVEVNAGTDVELTCDTAGVNLIGLVDNSVRDYSFEWFNSAGELIAEDDRINVTSPGLYTFVATDVDILCANRDTVEVLPNAAQPAVNLIDSAAIDCDNPSIQLLAEVSNTDSFTFSWTALNGGVLVEDTLNPLSPTVTVAGTFLLSVVDTATTCTTMDSVIVVDNSEEIVVDAGEGGELTCQSSSLQLIGQAPEGLTYTWTLNGEIVGTDSTNLEATTAGTYILTASNPSTGCSNLDSVIVTSAAELPEISFVSIPSINCSETEVSLQTEVTPADASYTISWSIVDLGTIISGSDALSTLFGAAGTYRIEVTNDSTGCSSVREVLIAADTTAPVANAGMDQILTCSQDTAILSGLGSSESSTILYSWTALEGGSTPLDPDLLQTTITSAGTYRLEVRDTATGCVASDVVLVQPDTALPNVQLAMPDILTCQMGMVSLDASGSDSGTGFTIAFNALEGQAPPQVGPDGVTAVVTEGGTYQVLVTNVNTGCRNVATQIVEEQRNLPTASAGENVIIFCPGTAVNLDGSGSSQGANFTYNWTSLSGAAVNNATSLSPSVDQPGQFELEVSDTTNGCSNTAIVEALLDPNLTVADAGMDDSACDGDAAVFAVSPLGATGQWSTTSAAIIDLPSGNSTTISNLQPGSNVFAWTLSTPDCPNYSSDSITIVREEAPIANPDETVLDIGATEATINVRSNDIVTAATVNINIINAPMLGAIDPDISRGNVTYRVARGVFGEDSFVYEICNSECLTLCDTSSVNVSVQFDPNFVPVVVNGITPNGDGQNDELRFESLEIDPDAFPDNELIVFSRWGDIVYQAKPYNNDWKGTTTAGLELPQGTYYYILRLDISEGTIIKGDITIIK